VGGIAAWKLAAEQAAAASSPSGPSR
jgi:hypothetical protein